MAATNNFQLTLVNSYMLNSRMRHLEFAISDDQRFSHTPGQFVSLHIPNGEQIARRNFSIANPPSDNYNIEIAATFVPNGIASTALWHMQSGDQLTANGPLGIFVLPSQATNTKRYILVATGTGVTPYRAMQHKLSEWLQDPSHQCTVLLGVRDYYELLYKTDFTALAATHPNFKFIACYSRENPATSNRTLNPDDAWVDQRFGYVQQQLESLNIDGKNDLIYLCGNPNMVEESLKIIDQHQIPRYKVKREKYISSK